MGKEMSPGQGASEFRVASNINLINPYADTFEAYIHMLEDCPQTTPEEVATLVKERDAARRTKDEEAYHEAIKGIVLGNLRLVVSRTRHLNYSNLTRMDLIQEGNVGLILAAINFDPSINPVFSTYAVWKIRGAINYATRTSSLVRIPEYPREMYKKVRRASSRLEQVLERNPTSNEIARFFDVPRETIDDVIKANRPELRFERQINSETTETFGDVLPDPDRDVETEGLSSYESSHLRVLLKQLPEQQRLVLEYRFGFVKDSEPKNQSLRAVGKILGVSYERVRIVEEEAINALRLLMSLPTVNAIEQVAITSPITDRQKEILSHLKTGDSRGDIARKLGIAVGTLNTIINIIKKKYKVVSVEDLIIKAQELGDVT